MILQALLLVTNQAEAIKGLLTAVHSFVCCCPFLHSPVPLHCLIPALGQVDFKKAQTHVNFTREPK